MGILDTRCLLIWSEGIQRDHPSLRADRGHDRQHDAGHPGG